MAVGADVGGVMLGRVSGVPEITWATIVLVVLAVLLHAWRHH
jgi:predicted MFS family arabinose efflux permease